DRGRDHGKLGGSVPDPIAAPASGEEIVVDRMFGRFRMMHIHVGIPGTGIGAEAGRPPRLGQ
ncbi:hypothetical protein, partial [Sinorhizobium medicae]|uniref:hypothetical protein n=1 Tax=Sinorhizobium medicae TaxID=110321 RepID=UPI001AED14E6